MNIRKEILYNGVVDTIIKIYRNEGILAFWKGFTPNLMRLFPSSGVFFLTYEFGLKLMNYEGK